MANPAPDDVQKARDCGCGPGGCGPQEIDRRAFLGVNALAMLGAAFGSGPPPHQHPVPAEKKLPPEWLAGAARVQRNFVYRGEQLRRVAFPLGGIGTGFVALSGDGDLVEWQIFNNVNKKARVPRSGLFVEVIGADGNAARIALRRGDRDGARGFANAEMVGEYPFAELRLTDPAHPIEATIEAFNPLVPLVARASSFPAALLRVRLKNVGARAIDANVGASLLNAVGWDGYGEIESTTEGCRFAGFESTRARPLREEGAPKAVLLDAPTFKPASFDRSIAALVIGTAPVLGERDATAELALTTRAALGDADLDGFDLVWVNADADPPSLDELRRVLAWVERGGALAMSEAEGGWMHAARRASEGAAPSRTRTLASFEGADYGEWKAEGSAFGKGPSTGPVHWQQPIRGWTGRAFVNSFQPDDAPQGTLTSPEFALDRDFVHLRVGGGAFAGATCVNLVVDGEVVRTGTGRASEELTAVHWDARPWRGKRARIQAVDRASGGWGHVLLDDVRVSDDAGGAVALDNDAARELLARAGAANGRIALRAEARLDGRAFDDLVESATGVGFTPASGRKIDDAAFGSMAIAALDGDGSAFPTTSRAIAASASVPGRLNELAKDFAAQLLSATWTLDARESAVAGYATRALKLEPGAEGTATFAIAWHFPNRHVSGKRVGNHYATQWKDAADVVRDLAVSLPRLEALARAYRDALYGSTLPKPILDAAGSQASIVRSPTVMRLGDGHVAAYEGLGEREGCCPMNCCHVFNYAQTMARLFPELERDVRRLDLEHQQNADGGVNNRIAVPIGDAPSGERPFADGHLGTVLKTYREHLNSTDDAFLHALWPRVKKALDYAITVLDGNGDGVLEGAQWNTYDQVITGVNTFVGTLYLAALRAGEEMAKRMGEPELAARYRKLFESGSARYAEIAWNGEFFDQKGGSEVGMGCMADQLLGEWWARVLGLGSLLPREKTRSALAAIYRHNFLPDFSAFRHSQRVFADGKDRGLLNVAWPRGGRPGTAGFPGKPILYCDEAWTGVEYQVAALMLWEGMLEPALAIVRGARDRYDGTKRNPWNEIECGDQYARAMSSWSLVLAAQGSFVDGPAGVVAFEPRFATDDHRFLFTGPASWGTFAMKVTPASLDASIELAAGTLALEELRLACADAPTRARLRPLVTLGDGETAATITAESGVLRVRFAKRVEIAPAQRLRVALSA